MRIVKPYLLSIFLGLLTAVIFSGCSAQLEKKTVENHRREIQNVTKTKSPLKNTETAGQNNLHMETEKLFFEQPEAVPASVSIKIYKKARTLELYGDNKLIGRFRIALGRLPEGDKTREGDSKTPEGSYYICTRNGRSAFTRFLGLSYPGIKDAKKGLEDGLISQKIFDAVRLANNRKQQPPWNTLLGGAVGIHGGGTASDWTLGCIALSDEDIMILWKYVPIKTPVEIIQ